MKKSWQVIGLAALAGLGYWLWKQSQAKKPTAGGAGGAAAGGGTTSSVVPRSVASVPVNGTAAASNTSSLTSQLTSGLLSTAFSGLGSLLGLNKGGGGAGAGSGGSFSAKGALDDLFGSKKKAAVDSTASTSVPAQDLALQYDPQSGLFYDPTDPSGTVYSDMWGNTPVGTMTDFALGSPYTEGSDYIEPGGTVEPVPVVTSTPIGPTDSSSSEDDSEDWYW